MQQFLCQIHRNDIATLLKHFEFWLPGPFLDGLLCEAESSNCGFVFGKNPCLPLVSWVSPSWWFQFSSSLDNFSFLTGSKNLFRSCHRSIAFVNCFFQHHWSHSSLKHPPWHPNPIVLVVHQKYLVSAPAPFRSLCFSNTNLQADQIHLFHWLANSHYMMLELERWIQ